MHLRLASRIARLIALVLVATSATFTSTTPAPTSAAGHQTWWVATSGTPVDDPASNPASGTGCATPHFVGTDHLPIQAALDLVNPGDTVHLCAGTYHIENTVLVKTSGALSGAGARHTILDGGGNTRIMSIEATVGHTTGFTMSGLQFRHGRITEINQRGGAVLAHPSTTVTISASLFRDNSAVDDHGGAVAMTGNEGVANLGSLQIHDSTFVTNIAGVDGGAVSAAGLQQTSQILNSTFVGNGAGRDGGAVNATFGSLEVRHSTFVDNWALHTGSAVYRVHATHSLFAATSRAEMCSAIPGGGLGTNVSTDPSCLTGGSEPHTREALSLRFLAPWGGPTPTVALGPTSSAVGAITTGCAASDQRGIPRTAPCTAGAFEFVTEPGQITPREISIPFIANNPILNYAAPVVTGFSDHTFRLATEVNEALPAGVTFSSVDGRLSGTPTLDSTAQHFVITATNSSGHETSMRVIVDNCTLTRQGSDYLIAHRSDLDLFARGLCGWEGQFRQTANINWDAPWQQVGTHDRPFTGTYHGGGHSITGLQITGGNFTAFISHAVDATISALRFSAEVTGFYGSAGLLGYSEGSTVIDVHGTGTISGTGESGCLGGLLGEIYAGGNVHRSSFQGTIHDPNGSWVGGLAGCIAHSEVATSYFRGTVIGADEVGGLVGWMAESEITDSFAEGEASSPGILGGLIGFQILDGPDADVIALTNSYASVTLSSDPNATVGGLIGSGESTATLSSFWEDGLPGTDQVSAIGNLHDAGTPPDLTATSATDMRRQGHFQTAGWSIRSGWQLAQTTSTTWGICDGLSLPFPLWLYTTDPCVSPTSTTNTPGGTGSGDTTDLAPPNQPSTGGLKNPTGSTASIRLSPGDVQVLIDGETFTTTEGHVEARWIDEITLVVRIAGIELAVQFPTVRSGASGRGHLQKGADFAISAQGLQALSAVRVVMYSTPTELAELSSDALGALAAQLAVPETVTPGLHRLALDMVDAQGRRVEIWIGVEVLDDFLTLPSAGKDTQRSLFFAAWLMVVGVGLHFGRRRHLFSLR